MVDFDWKSTKMVSSDIPSKSPKLSSKLQIKIPAPIKIPSSSPIACSGHAACSAYELYLRLPELRKLWSSRDFPQWKNEPILKPALQALEITFRLVSVVMSDYRPYANTREWSRRLEALATSQIQLVALICEEDDDSAPIAGATSSGRVLARYGSPAEVWSIPGGDKTTIVNHPSEASLLPRLATWQKSEEVAQKIMFSIECEMQRCKYTLGLGEPNFAGKPNLRYDEVCRPIDLHSLKKNPYFDQIENHENQTLYTTHQILESWINVSRNLLKRIDSRIEDGQFEKSSIDVCLLERIWKLLAEIEDLHLLMDPDDFLKLKNQLHIKYASQKDAFCFRSKGLVEVTKMSKDLKHKVPAVLTVEVDPSGWPRIQEAAMRLYGEKREFEKIHLLQGLQAVEAALKRFFYSYRQSVAVMMGTVEANANLAVVSHESCDSLTQIFMEPTYFPSLDAAKTFLGESWSHRGGKKKDLILSNESTR